ncbi:hypothetical protein [Streptomyces sp. AV19]|uniref:hypothetical protein n=1 Tax=Streptomyces sp. AV19 TaxID=2793068 RepID=UPI002413664F|nr:hypothetical protein [Streptomyces sp. AV19]MDG4533895.1 hypothetical protein [Streptomyces sp. AV19]
MADAVDGFDRHVVEEHVVEEHVVEEHVVEEHVVEEHVVEEVVVEEVVEPVRPRPGEQRAVLRPQDGRRGGDPGLAGRRLLVEGRLDRVCTASTPARYHTVEAVKAPGALWTETR